MSLVDKVTEKLADLNASGVDNQSLQEAERLADEFGDIEPVPYHVVPNHLFHEPSRRPSVVRSAS